MLQNLYLKNEIEMLDNLGQTQTGVSPDNALRHLAP